MTTRQKRKLLLAGTVCTITTFIIICAIVLYNSFWNIQYSQITFTESTKFLNNPYRGWYNLFGYELNENGANYYDNYTINYINHSSDTRLVLIEINLKNYNTGELSASALAQTDRILTQWGRAGYNVILRFLYDWDGNAAATEPKSISIIKRHMEQSSAIVNQHTDDIFCMQGIFVGNFAEMHGSPFLTDDYIRELATCLDSYINPDIYLSVRTPQHLRIMFQTTDVSSRRLNDAVPYRWGLYNDGMMGSDLDLGTYGPADYYFDENNYSSKGNREQELEFQNQLCLKVPNGGEAVLDNEYNDINNACASLATMHVSYLNQLHDLSVINKWKKQIYTGNDIFNQMSGYDYITRHLGYRYVIRKSSCEYPVFSKKGATFNITIDNVGFAPSYKDFAVMAFITDTSGNVVYSYDLSDSVKTSEWAYTSNTVSFALTPGQIKEGEYDVYFSVCDKPDKEFIEFGVENDYSPDYGYHIGSFKVSK